MSYYERNKERIKAKRKLLYQSDPGFRELQKKRVVASRKKKSAERKKLKAELKQVKKIWKKINVGGSVKLCCRIEHLAKGINRKPITIRLWIREGKFPETFKFRGQRYYTYAHYNFAVKLFEKYSGQKELAGFSSELKNKWDSLYKEKKVYAN